MIKSITVTNHLDENITLELTRPEKSGFVVLNIDGLGPSKANINSIELSSIDGSIYTSSKVTSRNIVIKLKFLSSPTIEDVRQKSYKYFPIKKRIKLAVETDNRVCEIYGYVESNEPDIFSKEEGTQISIMCPDPYFYSTNKNICVFYAVEPLFESEFSNESFIDNDIELSNLVNETQQVIYYPGDIDVGIFITMHALGTVENVTIYNTMTNESMKIDTDRLEQLTGFVIIAGDEITISTVKGNKYITLTRNGEYVNILNCLDKGVDWLQMVKGDNIFAYDAEVGITNLEFRIENQIVYEGV